MRPPLAIGRALFDRLEAAGIRHCHWKSNEHLAAALAGETDVDLLVDAARAAEVDAVLAELRFRRFRSPNWVRFPGIFDWLGFDTETGRLLHVHLHHQLLTGRRFVKEHHLPFERAVLDSSALDPVHGVRVPHPAVELLLLLFRLALKNEGISDAAHRELAYLEPRVDKRDLEAWAHELLAPADAAALSGLLVRGSIDDLATLARIRPLALRTLADHSRMPKIEAAARAPLNRLRFLLARVARRLDLPGQLGKRLETQGALVAVIGSDGAGKSTVAAELAHWLAWKADARTVYLGVGEGRVGLRVRVLRRLARTAQSRTGAPRRVVRTGARPSGSVPTRVRVPGLLRDLGAGLLHDAMADERLGKLHGAHRFRDAGGILLTDRFPQTQFPGIYDGPRTTRSDRDSFLRRRFAQREQRKYAAMAEMAPDIVLKLHVPVELALSRKPGHSAEGVRRKVDLTVALQFPRSRVFDVDASRPLAEVVLDCKRILWEHL